MAADTANTNQTASTTSPHVFVGSSPLKKAQPSVKGRFVTIEGERFYQIENYDEMPPFFMTLVSGGDHWFFISSNGGLTAGRRHADVALFPYETEDKLTLQHESVGSQTIFLVTRNGRRQLWEPFSDRYGVVYQRNRNIYKNIYGNTLIFEEVNLDLGLTYQLMWQTGERFGFIKRSTLINNGESCQVSLIDGLRNLLPHGATAILQSTMSSLLDAYKRSDLDPDSGLGVFALSATLTDRAEPSESLMGTAAWQSGIENPVYLLSTAQLDAFRNGGNVIQEEKVLGRPAAYLVQSSLALEADETRQWHIVADIEQDGADVVNLIDFLSQDDASILKALKADIASNTAALVQHIAASDGLQMSRMESTSVHHIANVMFNVMRGGIFANGYLISRADLIDFVEVRNRPVLEQWGAWFNGLPERVTIQQLYDMAQKSGSPDLLRLAYEYLPLTFSRRHGDPSRPWNRFAINLKKEDGSPRLDYQGNWRDIFQNWEPLALSFPDYGMAMIAKFLNATTADGYNPYRVTRDGIEWEVPEPDNPWANIGYWSDHQIIYLQKFLEHVSTLSPGEIEQMWQRPLFTYANVPYRIRPYHEILRDWYNTIDFDWDQESIVNEAVDQIGMDGRLVLTSDGEVRHVTMVEKLLVLLLAKLTNLVPEGGIWMNTQRPEWNDANNALVGKGISVVTAAYLRRFIAFWRTQLADKNGITFQINTAVAELLAELNTIFDQYSDRLKTGFDNVSRRQMVDQLGGAASRYRAVIYAGLPEENSELSADSLTTFLGTAQGFIEQTLRQNRRPDGLYHAYNIMRLGPDSLGIDYLYPMLEGQVAILSSGLLSSAEALEVVTSMRQSELYREDQHTYMLYPNRELSTFFEKNRVPASAVAESQLVAQLRARGDGRLLVENRAGDFHFNGLFRNVNDLDQVLDEMTTEDALAPLVAAEWDAMRDLFELTFNHRAFTGRSGTFFAFEGLGSVYWHMVSKLLLAVQECYMKAESDAEAAALAEAYYDIRAGIGFNKTPEVYGAFPTDPYSHTPFGSGARQPGMTGQVKEELLTRWGELGLSIHTGQITFDPTLLKEDEFLNEPAEYRYSGLDGKEHTLLLKAGSLAFTYCQTPIIYQIGDEAAIEVMFKDGQTEQVSGKRLNSAHTQAIFRRDQTISRIVVTVVR